MLRDVERLLLGSCALIAACDDPIFPDADADAAADRGPVMVLDDAGAPPPALTEGGLDGGNTDVSIDSGNVDASRDATTTPDRCASQTVTPPAYAPAVAVGDLDQDGKLDFVVGDPEHDEGRGAVCFVSGALWQSSGALDACQRWTQDDDSTSGPAEAKDGCGATLATGDFNGDGVDDVAIGCPGEGFRENEPEAGQLTIVFGKSGFGPDFARTQTITQTDMGRDREAYDHFAIALAAADFNADGVSDLAMGAPNESVTVGSLITDTGVVNFLYGKVGVGLDPTAYVGIGQGDSFRGADVAGAVAGRDDTYEPGDLFGSALAVANLSFSGVVRPTLIIGAPGEDNGKGVVHLLAGGTSSGLGMPTARAVLSASGGTGVGFGRSLAAMGSQLVFVGAPYAHDSAGAVWVFDTTVDDWANPTKSEIRSIEGKYAGPEPDDLFGYSLFATATHLLVGVPGKDLRNSQTCNDGSVERFDSDLQSQTALVGEGHTGFGMRISGFEQDASGSFALVTASDASLAVRPLD